MVINRAKQKIKNLHQEPEEIRHRFAVRYVMIAIIVIALIWLFIFLPLQLSISRPPANSEIPVVEDLPAIAEPDTNQPQIEPPQ